MALAIVWSDARGSNVPLERYRGTTSFAFVAATISSDARAGYYPGAERMTVKVLAERGQWADRPDGIPVLVTLHPSALLRGEPAEREREFERLVADLRVASNVLGGS